MALCFRNESAETEPKESLMDCSVVENFIRREGKGERCHFSIIQFPYGFLRMFFFSISKDSIVFSGTISSFPYHSAHQPLTL